MKVVMKKTGQVKNVPDGYAKNYLLPNGLAVKATPQALADVERQEKQRKQTVSQQEQQWNAVILALQSDPLVVTMPANTEGVLFGAVTAKEVVLAARERGLEVDAAWIPALHMKHVGEQNVHLTLPNKKKYAVTIRIVASA